MDVFTSNSTWLELRDATLTILCESILEVYWIEVRTITCYNPTKKANIVSADGRTYITVKVAEC